MVVLFKGDKRTDIKILNKVCFYFIKKPKVKYFSRILFQLMLLPDLIVGWVQVSETELKQSLCSNSGTDLAIQKKMCVQSSFIQLNTFASKC